jgi:hypothetical protein
VKRRRARHVGVIMSDKAGYEIAYRMGWVIKYLYDHCKIPGKNMNQFESGIDVWKNHLAFNDMLAMVAAAEHSYDRAPDSPPVLEKIKDPYTVAHIVLATKKMHNITLRTLDENAERAFIPNTRFKRMLQQIGVEFLKNVEGATLGGTIQK